MLDYHLIRLSDGGQVHCFILLDEQRSKQIEFIEHIFAEVNAQRGSVAAQQLFIYHH